MNESDDRWITTYTGIKYWPLTPRVEDVRIEDIAHALSLICRFGGHCRQFYSVAQHSVLVSLIVPKEDALHGLLHDAAEAYLGDVLRPIKAYIPGYRDLEVKNNAVIAIKFGLLFGMPGSIKEADMILLSTEHRDLMNDTDTPWSCDIKAPLSSIIVPMTQREAERYFLLRFNELQHKD